MEKNRHARTRRVMSLQSETTANWKLWLCVADRFHSGPTPKQYCNILVVKQGTNESDHVHSVERLRPQCGKYEFELAAHCADRFWPHHVARQPCVEHVCMRYTYVHVEVECMSAECFVCVCVCRCALPIQLKCFDVGYGKILQRKIKNFVFRYMHRIYERVLRAGACANDAAVLAAALSHTHARCLFDLHQWHVLFVCHLCIEHTNKIPIRKNVECLKPTDIPNATWIGRALIALLI